MTTIQAAIDAAVAGDAVALVAPGTYPERLSIYAKDVTVESVGGPDVTTIDGGDGGTVVYVYAAPGETPEFRGFTVTNGYGGSDAGGMSIYGDVALVEGNRVTGNWGCLGGGIAAGFSNAIIRDNTIDHNGLACSGGMGAGVFIGGAGAVQLLGGADHGQLRGRGGAERRGSADDRREHDLARLGHGDRDGQPLRCPGQQQPHRRQRRGLRRRHRRLVPMDNRGPIIVNNTFVDNTAFGGGSAIYLDGFDADSQVTNNVIVASSAQAAIECTAGYDPAFAFMSHNDVRNTAGPGYGGACPDQTGLNGNVSVDPLFRDPAGGDYHLRCDSPLLDAGTNAGAPAIDADGDSRPFDSDSRTGPRRSIQGSTR